jgi:hypothetical protein
MHAALRELLGELTELSESLTRVRRSAALRRLPNREPEPVPVLIPRYLNLLHTAQSERAHSNLSPARAARLRKKVRDAVTRSEGMLATQFAEGVEKWLSLLSRLARELDAATGGRLVATSPDGRTAPPSRMYSPPVPAFAPAAAPTIERAPRYANTTVLDGSGQPLHPSVSLKRNQKIRLRIDIGALSADSHVSAGAAFPDKALPKDVHIDVMISSTDFAGGDGKGGGSFVAHGHFFLPANGGPAIARDGTTFITFELTTPAQTGVARCRIGFYFRNTLVQSQQLTAAIGRTGGFRIVTDFTVSRDLTGLDRIPDRPRLSILTNLNQQGTHQIVLRAVDPHSSAIDARTFVVNETTVGTTVGQIRTALAERAPTSRQRRQSELIQDLKKLAVPGWSLYTQLAAQNLDTLSGWLTARRHSLPAIPDNRPSATIPCCGWAIPTPAVRVAGSKPPPARFHPSARSSSLLAVSPHTRAAVCSPRRATMWCRFCVRPPRGS